MSEEQKPPEENQEQNPPKDDKKEGEEVKKETKSILDFYKTRSSLTTSRNGFFQKRFRESLSFYPK